MAEGRGSVSVEILQGDALARLRELPADSVHACITSPPYWQLRSYLPEQHPDKALELGLESTPEAYVERLVEVFREVRRALRPEGTLWLNLGDSYAGGGRGGGGSFMAERGEKSWKKGDNGHRSAPRGYKPKDLVGIPWMVALALRADGWWLRADIVWRKTNPQPESVDDRPTRAHEYVFLLAKSERYFYDAFPIREPHRDVRSAKTGSSALRGQATLRPLGREESAERWYHPDGRNARSVWDVPTHPSGVGHYAVFPEELVKRCILAGSSESCCAGCGASRQRVVESQRLRDGEPVQLPPARNAWPEARVHPRHTEGIGHNRIFTAKRHVRWVPSCSCGALDTPTVVLDPFGGSGTVGRVATRLGRRALLIELHPEYVELARARCAQQGLFTVRGGGLVDL